MESLEQTLKRVGGLVVDSHFVGTNGKHFPTYVNKDALFPHVEDVSDVCHDLAQSFKDDNIDVVAGPTIGAVILSQWTAYHLGKLKGSPVQSVYVEKKDGGFALTRGYDKVVTGKNVLVVEDVTTSGGSLVKVIEAVKQAGGNVVGAGVMVNKNPDEITDKTFGTKLVSLLDERIDIYPPEDCPLCESGVPINTDLGHGKAFLDSQI